MEKWIKVSVIVLENERKVSMEATDEITYLVGEQEFA
jgi:hypothetical protein